MEFRAPHRWDVTPAEARAIQVELAGRVVLADALKLEKVRLVAGVDDAYVKGEDGRVMAHAAAVVLTFPVLEVVETAFGAVADPFPYVPGLLSFREVPAVLAALGQLTATPDVVLCDGQGYAHPRRFGLACHLGLVLGRPTVGCAKTRLVGRHAEPGAAFGATAPLVDRDEVVGAAVRTRPGHAPLYVSPGHQVSVEGAVAIALACCRDGAFLPVPTRAAHEAVTAHTKPLRRSARGRP